MKPAPRLVRVTVALGIVALSGVCSCKSQASAEQPDTPPPTAAAPANASAGAQPPAAGSGAGSQPTSTRSSFAQARTGFNTERTIELTDGEPAGAPPEEVFEQVTYPAPDGELAAYVSPEPGDDKQHPMIIWRVGGFSNSIGDVWSPAEADDDQTASSFREQGVLMMHASARGGNDNPGANEYMYGEVDDLLAAARFARDLPYVDPERVYLGGHSSGGTLVLLTAAAAEPDLLRAVFALGPAARISDYDLDPEQIPFDLSDRQELMMRSPIEWLDSIQTPTYVIEGADSEIAASIREMKAKNKDEDVHFLLIDGHDHFSVLRPTNEVLAQAILADTDTAEPFSFDEQVLSEIE